MIEGVIDSHIGDDVLPGVCRSRSTCIWAKPVIEMHSI